MSQRYFTLLTNLGAALHANAQLQQSSVPWTHLVLGDGNGVEPVPSPTQTSVVNEVDRIPITSIESDIDNPGWIVITAVIPAERGGYVVRETALMGGRDGNQCIAVGNYPAATKALPALGAGSELVIRVVVQISSTATVILKIDPAVVIASRDYVDKAIQSEFNKRDYKQSVRVATVAPITLSGEQSIDSVAVVAGDRVLVKDQAAAAANGIYVVAIGFWTRAMDADSGEKLNPGATVPVEGGTVNADTQWVLKTDGQVTVGTTALVFQWFGGLNAPDQPLGDRSRNQANTSFVGAAVEAFAKASGRVVIKQIGVTQWPVPEILRSGHKKARVRGVGGGGGPARKSGGPLGTQVTGGSGGGGFDIVVSLESIETVPVTVGGGGTVGAGLDSPGTPGGSTSFGTFATGTGGPGGWDNGSSPGGGEAVSSVPGAILISGQGGGISFARSDAAGVLGGPGGASMLGFGGVASISGSGPSGYGGGAGASVVGGVFDGAQGVVIIEW